MIKSGIYFVVCVLLSLTQMPAQTGFDASIVKIQHIVFSIDSRKQTTTVVLNANLQNPPDSFYQFIAAPFIPDKIELVRLNSIEWLDASTQPSIDDPFMPCHFTQRLSIGDGGYFGYIEEEPTKIVRQIVVRGVNGLERLTAENYSATQAEATSIQHYLEIGWNIIGLAIQRQNVSNQSQFDQTALPTPPIAVTYSRTQPEWLSPVFISEGTNSVPILTWVFADQKYLPENYPVYTVDFSQMHGFTSLVAQTGYLTDSPRGIANVLHDDYVRLRQELISSSEIGGFVLEMAEPIAENIYIDGGIPASVDTSPDAVWNNLVADKKFLTRLYTKLPSLSERPTPTFSKASDNEAFSNFVDLDDWVNPFAYWGCSSLDLISTQIEQNLPLEHQYFPELKADIAYPSGWQISFIEQRAPIKETSTDQYPSFYGIDDIRIFAPQTVDMSTFDTYFANGYPFPMFMVARVSTTYVRMPEPEEMLLGILKRENLPLTGHWLVGARYEPILDSADDYSRKGMLVALFAPPDDWRQNHAVYDAMIQYAQAYQFFTQPNLRHTLFWGNELNVVQIPFPENWMQSYVLGDGNTDETTHHRLHGDLYLTPQQTAALADTAYIRLRRLNNHDEKPLEAIVNAYHLDVTIAADDFGQFMPFSANGRRGYLYIKQIKDFPTLIVEISAPVVTYSKYEALLNTIKDGIVQAEIPAFWMG
jgi:hypothetical protein